MGSFLLSILNTTKHFHRLSYCETLDQVLTFIPLQILFIINLLHMNLLPSLFSFGSLEVIPKFSLFTTAYLQTTSGPNQTATKAMG
jgi:hypothetical protein